MHKPTPDASWEERETWIRGKYEYKVRETYVPGDVIILFLKMLQPFRHGDWAMIACRSRPITMHSYRLGRRQERT
eukprot:56384-Eustigmatos_ZCMA.PRE.1